MNGVKISYETLTKLLPSLVLRIIQVQIMVISDYILWIYLPLCVAKSNV